MSTVVLTRSTVADFRSGDTTAFQAVARVHLRLVRSIVGRYFRQIFEQEEALQEVWLQVLRQRESFDLERHEQLDRWISVVAKRRCIDLLRQSGRRPPTSELEDVADVATATLPDQDSGVEASELRQALDEFKRRLRPQWREFFELHFVEGHSHPETASALGVTIARSKYMKRVLVSRSQKNRALMDALGRSMTSPGREGGHDAS